MRSVGTLRAMRGTDRETTPAELELPGAFNAGLLRFLARVEGL